MEISEDHKSRKKSGYWTNLVQGDTGVYKAEAIDALLDRAFSPTCDAILDIGCGTSVIATSLRERLQASRLTFMDYDAAVIEGMRLKLPDPSVEWKVGDIFQVGAWERRFDLVLMLDMLHEVYSFYGRPVREMESEIDHARGQDAVRRALQQVAQIVNPGGGIIITDNVLCPTRPPVLVRLRNHQTQAAVSRFLAEYPSRRMSVTWHGPDTLSLDSHDFCILLTQYNKIKAGNEDRWNVEKFEIHQYMTDEELRFVFDELGFSMVSIIGTPPAAMAEWVEDFEVLDGLPGLPEKRITSLAIRRP